MVCKEAGSDWGWSDMVVLLERPCQQQWDSAAGSVVWGIFKALIEEHAYFTMRTTAHQHLERGEKLKRFPTHSSFHYFS